MERFIRRPKVNSLAVFKLLILAAIASFLLSSPALAAPATVASSQNQLAFNSFTGVYHLSRDTRGLSLLTTEETIVADFPATGLYGINRSLPQKFQGRPVNIKVLNVSDAAGDPVPYKTAKNKDGNLVITTGDPAITLYGSQTIKIKYQTSGVINLTKNADHFLLNVNGRGWEQPFGKVDAFLFIPARFSGAIKGSPQCYTSFNSAAAPNPFNTFGCNLNVKKTSTYTVITARARPVAAHQALVINLDFKPSTFTNNRSLWSEQLAYTVAAMLIIVVLITIYALRKTRRKHQT